MAKKRDQEGGDAARRFGLRLRALRKRAGLTQAELADVLGMDYQAISRLERGGSVPNWATVKRIAAAVKAAPNDFLTEDERQTFGLSREGYIPDTPSGGAE